MTQAGIYDTYLKDNPSAVQKIIQKNVVPKNKNQNKKFLDNWDNVSKQWISWLQAGSNTNPQQIPFIDTKYLQPKPTANAPVSNVVATLNVVATPNVAPVAPVQSGGEDNLRRDFLSWKQSSPFQFNIGMPKDQTENMLSKFPQILEDAGAARKVIREWVITQNLMPPEKSNQNKQMTFNKIVKNWHDEIVNYLTFSKMIETARKQCVRDFIQIKKLNDIPQTENLKFYYDLLAWKQGQGFNGLIGYLQQISQQIQQSGIRGEQTSKLQQQAQKILEQIGASTTQSYTSSSSPYSSSSYGSSSYGSSPYGSSSYGSSPYGSSPYGSRMYGGAFMPQIDSLQQLRYQLDNIRAEEQKKAFLMQHRATFDQIRSSFTSLYPYLKSFLLYSWLVMIQLDILCLIQFWRSFFLVNALESKESVWNFAYSWNAKRWEERITQWKDIDITWGPSPSFMEKVDTQLLSLENQTWRDLKSYLIEGDTAKPIENWWDLFEQNLITTEPFWNSIWNWGGWIVPSLVSKPVEWLKVPTVLYWNTWTNEIKSQIQVIQSNMLEGRKLTNTNKVNRNLRWKAEVGVNSGIQSILQWADAVQVWKKSLLLWKQEYETATDKQAVWAKFQPLLQRVNEIQKTWWVLLNAIPMGSLDSRRYWNYWWDLQRFFLQYFYFSITPEQEIKLYENTFRYGYNLKTKQGTFSPEGRQYLQALRQNPQARSLVDKLIRTPTYPLIVAQDGSKDFVFSWQPQTNQVLRSLDVETLWSPSWNFFSFWQTLFVSLGLWDTTKKTAKAHLFLPVRIVNQDYWICLEQLWKQLDKEVSLQKTTGLSVPAPAGEMPVFFNYNQLFTALTKPLPQKRQQNLTAVKTTPDRPLPADWATLFQANKVKPWIVLSFTQQQVSNGIWSVDSMPALTNLQKMPPAQILDVAKKTHPLIWISWVARLLLGQWTPITPTALVLDKRQPKGQTWEQQATMVMTALDQEIKKDENFYQFGPQNRNALGINKGTQWWKIETQGEAKGDDSKVRKWLLEQERTGEIWSFKKSVST